MARKKTRRKKPEEEYFHIAIRVERFETKTEASIHRDTTHPEFAYRLDDSDPVYRFTTELTIFGTAFDPKARAGHTYEIDIYTDDSSSSSLQLQLKDLHSRDERGLTEYRTWRGKEAPVYVKPAGLGPLNKERGRAHWTSWARVLPRSASDMLLMLNSGKDLYLALTETVDERARWLWQLSLQTRDPTTEE